MRARVSKGLRVRAKRAAARGRKPRECAQRAAEIDAGRHDGIGRNAVFGPVDHRCEHVEMVRRSVATAVPHVGNQVKLHEVPSLTKHVIVIIVVVKAFVPERRLPPVVTLRHLVEVLNGVRPRRTRVAQAVVEDQLATVVGEG